MPVFFKENELLLFCCCLHCQWKSYKRLTCVFSFSRSALAQAISIQRDEIPKRTIQNLSLISLFLVGVHWSTLCRVALGTQIVEQRINSEV